MNKLEKSIVIGLFILNAIVIGVSLLVSTDRLEFGSGGVVFNNFATIPVSVGDGGTGAASFTDGSPLFGSGTAAITALGVMANSEFIVGDGSGDPVFESGATLRTSIGVGTGDSPTFTGLTLTGLGNLNGAFVSTGSSTVTAALNVQHLFASSTLIVDGQVTLFGNVGIGFSNPAAALDIDSNSNTQSLRLRGANASTEIADFYVNGIGSLLIDLIAGNDTGQFLDLRTEDDLFGLVIRESDGTGSTAHANFYVTDAADDFLSIVVSAGTSGDAFNVTALNRIGLGSTTPVAKLSVNGNIVVEPQALTDGTTITIDWALGNVFFVTLGGSRTIAFSNVEIGQAIRVYYTQDSTGSRTLTHPGTVTFLGGAPTLSTGGGETDILIYSTATSTLTVHASYSIN